MSESLLLYKTQTLCAFWHRHKINTQKKAFHKLIFVVDLVVFCSFLFAVTPEKLHNKKK